MVLRQNVGGVTEDDRRRLEITSEIRLGEMVNRIRRINVPVSPDCVVVPRAFLATVSAPYVCVASCVGLCLHRPFLSRSKVPSTSSRSSHLPNETSSCASKPASPISSTAPAICPFTSIGLSRTRFAKRKSRFGSWMESWSRGSWTVVRECRKRLWTAWGSMWRMSGGWWRVCGGCIRGPVRGGRFRAWARAWCRQAGCALGVWEMARCIHDDSESKMQGITDAWNSQSWLSRQALYAYKAPCRCPSRSVVHKVPRPTTIPYARNQVEPNQ